MLPSKVSAAHWTYFPPQEWRWSCCSLSRKLSANGIVWVTHWSSNPCSSRQLASADCCNIRCCCFAPAVPPLHEAAWQCATPQRVGLFEVSDWPQLHLAWLAWHCNWHGAERYHLPEANHDGASWHSYPLLIQSGLHQEARAYPTISAKQFVLAKVQAAGSRLAAGSECKNRQRNGECTGWHNSMCSERGKLRVHLSWSGNNVHMSTNAFLCLMSHDLFPKRRFNSCETCGNTLSILFMIPLGAGPL